MKKIKPGHRKVLEVTDSQGTGPVVSNIAVKEANYKRQRVSGKDGRG